MVTNNMTNTKRKAEYIDLTESDDESPPIDTVAANVLSERRRRREACAKAAEQRLGKKPKEELPPTTPHGIDPPIYRGYDTRTFRDKDGRWWQLRPCNYGEGTPYFKPYYWVEGSENKGWFNNTEFVEKNA